ncbi:expressed unknown protein [Seminavis robusta]|uniref:Uncharacterized protein n=1 Tax=Seminavis robusta TaxID=568900 RepID=A0A9N8DF95_9STRA|nr:expressed unknown protein [Seminavis robusta]|eukprot:Sro116_g056900.1 n/a (515) ;mRNA; f:199-1929
MKRGYNNNNNNNRSSGNNKKRKRREKLEQYGVDLPDIPGVPAEVIPLFVHAIKVSTKFFQHESLMPYTSTNNSEEEEEQSSEEQEQDGITTSSGSRSALDQVLNRMDASTQENSETRQQHKERKLKMRDAVQSWLAAVKRNVRTAPPPTTTATSQEDATAQNQYQQQQQRRSVPLSCFEYLWTIGHEHPRLAVRRAVLYMKRLLLTKSSDCRRFFLEEQTHLWQWVQMIVTTNGTEAKPFDPTKRLLWQREGHALLLQLIQAQYDALYPKLIVSEQYLRQACMILPNEAQEQPSFVQGQDDQAVITNMHSLRKLRDIAMAHGPEEIQRVQKLIRRSHQATDILVPRFGMEEDDKGATTEEPEPEETHAQAVERTLQAMAAMGGGLRNTGALQIQFDGSASGVAGPTTTTTTTTTIDNAAASQKLTQYARFLADRHWPRITAWIEGLTKADRLQKNRSKNNKALLLMSPQQGHARNELRQQLIHANAQIKTVLESAARLGLFVVGKEREQEGGTK